MLDVRKKFSTQSGEALAQAAKEVLGSPSLDVSKERGGTEGCGW